MYSKFQIKIKSLNKLSLNLYCKFLFKIFTKLNIYYKKVNLPKKKKKLTLLKSPHVHKKAREQFEFQILKKIIVLKKKINFKLLKFLIINKPNSLKISILKV